MSPMKRIKISQNREAIVDDEDFEKVSQWKWSYHHSGYVVRGKPQVSLHRLVMGAKKRQYIDHVNGNKLDNRKSNLRFCTLAQNQYNKLGTRNIPKGMWWRESRNAWIVRIQADGKRHWVGYFKEYDEALVARNEALKRLHGEFAKI